MNTFKMFICNDCVKKEYNEPFALLRSYGNCEVCGKTKECYDIHHSRLVKKNENIKNGKF